ncbi:MAG: carbohydrate ABC transporter permease [Oscillibacter sp.]|nr:carbohydrate ABC transporter permease [Oscillibacter sp.]
MNTKTFVKRVVECILLATLFLIFIFPFYWTLITSVKSMWEAIEFPPTFWPRKFVWSNYVEVWQGSNFSHFGKNSIILSVGATIIQIISSVMAAYAFARMEFRLKKPLFIVILADIMIPSQAIFLPIFIMYSRLGILNTYLSYFLIYIYSGSTIFFFRNAFKQVPEEMVEAARLDGASELSVMFRIMMPAVRPFLITQVMLAFIQKWNGYFWIQTLTTNDRIRTLPLALNSIANQVDEYITRWDLSMAGNVILMAPLLILYIFANRQMKVAFIGNGIK